MNYKCESRKSFFLITFLLFSIFISNNNFAADTLETSTNSRYRKSFGTNIEFGNVLLTHDFVRGNNPQQTAYNHYMAFTLEYGVETDGRKLYQQLWGYPTWGFGFYKIYFLNDSDLGSPFAAYTFFDAPFKRWEKWCINYKFGFGLSYNWARHTINEGYHYPIGSKMTVYFDMGLAANFHLSKKLDLGAEFVLTHFSNGSMQLPNYGLNLGAASLGLKYIFNERPEYKKQIVPKYEKDWELILLFSPAFKQVEFEYLNTDEQVQYIAFNYSIYNFSTTTNRQVSYKTKLGGGVDVSFNESYAADTLMVNGVPEKAPYRASDKLLVGIYPSVEFVINHVSLMLQPGFYIYRKNIENAEVPSTYQRIGIKYTFKNNIILGVNIRAYNFYKADFIEWNIGYSIRWKRNKGA